MSLFGKVLALFNIFGAIALVCLAAMDYGKRQSWAYAAFRHDLAFRGLPLDDSEVDAQGHKIAPQIGEATKSDLFKQAGGNPVATQIDEVRRVQGILDGKLQSASKPVGQTYLLARILLPLSDSLLERDQLLACQYWLSSDAAAKVLADHYRGAWTEAVKEASIPPLPGEREKTLTNLFQLALRSRPGQPSHALATFFLAAVPADAKKAASANFDKAFADALETQRAQLESRYKEHFNLALKGMDGNKNLGPDGQKAAVARLLFGLCPFQAEDAIVSGGQDPELNKLRPDSAAFAERITASGTFRTLVNRVYVVCGLHQGLEAISSRSALLRNLAGSLTGVMAQERLQFVADHAALVEQVRELAYRLQVETARKNDTERQLDVQKTLIKKRLADVKLLQDELNESRDKTEAKLKELRALSQQLLADRVRGRDLIRKTEEAEREIRELEKMVQEREASSR